MDLFLETLSKFECYIFLGMGVMIMILILVISVMLLIFNHKQNYEFNVIKAMIIRLLDQKVIDLDHRLCKIEKSVQNRNSENV